MADKIRPPVEPGLKSVSAAKERLAAQEMLEERLAAQERESLEIGRKAQDLAYQEDLQRYLIKWTAVVVGLLVIIAMGALLACIARAAFSESFPFENAAFAVAMIVAPVASITAITAMLFVGAFRKFEERDLDAAGSGAAGAARAIDRD